MRLEWNYHSNAIEGNFLTLDQTYSLLLNCLTAAGKPMRCAATSTSKAIQGYL